MASACLAALGVSLLAAHLFNSFGPVRLKLVKTPLQAADGRVTAPLPHDDRLAQLPTPSAVVVRVSNRTSQALSLTLRLGKDRLCTTSLAPHSTRRLDCTANGPFHAGTPFSIEGPSDGWSLDYLEFATHHGASSVGARQFVVLPSTSRAYEPSGWVGLLLLWALWTTLLAWQAADAPQWLTRLLEWVGIPILFLVAALVFAAPHLTRFAVILPAGPLGAWLAFGVLARAYPALGKVDWTRHLARYSATPTAACLLVAVFVTTAYGVVVHRRAAEWYQGHYGGLLLVSEARFDANPSLRGRDDLRRSLSLREDSGYDGQFAYFATFDPFLRAHRDDPAVYNAFIDAPPYRFGRIGLSLFTKVLSANQPAFYPEATIAVILIGVFATAFLLAKVAQDHGHSAAPGAIVLFIPGFWQSVQVGLPEPVAAALAIGGYVLLRKQRWWQAAVLFALALLTRETSAIFIACVLAWTFFMERQRRALITGVAAFAPWILWKLYVGWVLYPVWGQQAFVFDPKNMGAPFEGLSRMWKEAAAGGYYPDNTPLHRAGLVFPFLLVAGLVLSGVTLVLSPGPASLAAILYAIIGLSLNYDSIWLSVRNGERGTYELFLMLAVVFALARQRRKWLLAPLGAFWVALGIYWFAGDIDAEFIRDALIWPLEGLWGG